MLISKERLNIQMELDIWRMELLQNGLREIPLQGSTAIRAGQLFEWQSVRNRLELRGGRLVPGPYPKAGGSLP